MGEDVGWGEEYVGLRRERKVGMVHHLVDGAEIASSGRGINKYMYSFTPYFKSLRFGDRIGN